MTNKLMDDARSEEALVARAKRMHTAAWSEIYSSHHRVIYRYVRARVYDDGIAEELTSAVFLDAMEGIGRYRHQGRPLLAWLYRIASNSVADHQRKASVRRRLVEGLLPWKREGRQPGPSEQAEPASLGEDPAAGVERLDLQRAIGELPQAQRDVIILRHFAGLSTPEIAATMGKKASAVYSLEARALLSLRAKLTDP